MRLFVWLTLQAALPVNEHRHKCHLAPSSACSRCSSEVEDGLHALRDCHFSRDLWAKFGAWSWPNFRSANLRDWIQTLSIGSHARRFLAGLWGAWKWRCNMCLDPQPWTVEVAWRKLCQEHDEFMSILLPDSLEGGSDGLRITWKPSQ